MLKCYYRTSGRLRDQKPCLVVYALLADTLIIHRSWCLRHICSHGVDCAITKLPRVKVDPQPKLADIRKIWHFSVCIPVFSAVFKFCFVPQFVFIVLSNLLSFSFCLLCTTYFVFLNFCTSCCRLCTMLSMTSVMSHRGHVECYFLLLYTARITTQNL